MKLNFFFKSLFISEEIAEVKTELEEEGFTSDEAVKLIQQVYKKIGGFDNKSKEHSYPVHEKVSGQFQISKYLYYGNMGLWSFRAVGTKSERFLSNNQLTERKFLILRI